MWSDPETVWCRGERGREQRKIILELSNGYRDCQKVYKLTHRICLVLPRINLRVLWWEIDQKSQNTTNRRAQGDPNQIARCYKHPQLGNYDEFSNHSRHKIILTIYKDVS